MVSNILILLLVLSSFALPLQAQEVARGDTNDVYETKRYPYLTFPRFLWNGLVWPLGQFTIYAEHTELPQRVYNFFTNADHTFGLFPQVALGGETGTSGGLRLFHTNLFGAGKQLEALYTVRNADRHQGQLLYHDPNIAGSAFYWTNQAEYLKTDNRSATVNGALRQELFAIERMDASSVLGWRSNAGPLEFYTSQLAAELRVGYGRRDVEQVDESADSLIALAPGSTPRASRLDGVGAAIDLFSVGLRLAFDNRDFKRPRRELTHPLNYVLPGRHLLPVDELYYSLRDTGFPERGGLLQADADFVTGSDDVQYVRWSAEVQRFFTLFWRDRILALRARVDKVHRQGDDGLVPYTELSTLGGSQRLRGFKRGFSAVKGALLLSAEYRYPIWDTWNAFLFWDEGQVFDQFDDIETDQFHSSFGGGLSLRTASAVLLSVRIAHSNREDALVGFSLEQEF